MAAQGSTKVIIGSLLANLAIAAAKGVAAALTASGSMLAEAIHSGADCVNQLLLLLGVREARLPPSSSHPLGTGRGMYFWSFMVALMIFFGGGVVSIREGFHKLANPEPIANPWVGYAVLAIALAIEGVAAWQALAAIRKTQGDVPLWRHLGATKDADLVVLFAENSAAMVGLVAAMIALGLADLTGDSRWDALGSVAIGILLCGVAIWLGIELKSLLQGEAADPRIEASLRAEIAVDPRLLELLRIIAVQQGPGEVLVAAKVRLAKDLTTQGVVEAINGLEARMRARHPDLSWQFVEPDSEP